MNSKAVAIVVFGAAIGMMTGACGAPPTPLAKEVTLNLSDSVAMKLALIPAGKFLMGTTKEQQKVIVKEVASGGMAELNPCACSALGEQEAPEHEVAISQPFYMGVCEVTWEQYEAIIGPTPHTSDGKNIPVNHVLWEDAVVFCRKLSAKTGRKVRLPTEAEWEYACRAGTATRFSFGDKDGDLHMYANYRDKSCAGLFPWCDRDHDDGFAMPAPVGSFKPNPWGLYDMHGNVWEWCSDRYGDYPGTLTKDPQGPDSSEYVYRVLRGGAWVNLPGNCRSASRGRDARALGDYGRPYPVIGFRVVMVVG